ncbi:NUDIX hydrolase [Demequina sp. NBRC 110051]|uniref:NUDIX hydrolase n=1 Tax=Demequina sp. NBRC 110051 TaxID=1570340 RepID=UPI000A02B7A8|nr:NUDIX hydrolase [Demequina sp. NBRC 110051]
MSRPPVPRPIPAPPPPGGSALRRRRDNAAHRAAQLPVSNETSAGGIAITVVDGTAFAACIGRRNRAGKLEWCLPKGHIEGKETPEEAAIREVAEETGINAEIIRPIGVIDYWFTGDDRRVHKVVHHYLLEAKGGRITTENDPDHEAEVAEWIAVSDLCQRLAFPNERKMAQVAVDLLAIEP